MLLSRYKFRIARLIGRYPWLGRAGHRFWWLFQARFTVGAVGVIFNEHGQLLLLKHVYRTRYAWGLPGGYVSRHEDPAVAVVRELREETGLAISAVCALLVEQSDRPGHLDLAYLCRAVAPADWRLSSEILEYGWFDLEDLPELLGFHRRAIRRARQLQEGVAWA